MGKPIYNITYSTVINNLLPNQYRLNKMKAWLNTLIYPLQWLRDIFFDNYFYSSVYLYYDGSTTLPLPNAGTKVRFIDNSVWVTLVDNVDLNTNYPLSGTIYDTNGNRVWEQILTDSMGIAERITFNNQKIKFEYLLNRYFNPKGYLHLIYIGLNDMSTPYFVSYQNSDSSSSVFSRDINSAFYVYSGYYPQQTYNYTIYVPTQIANDLGPDYENIIRSIADIYNFESLLYSVTIY